MCIEGARILRKAIYVSTCRNRGVWALKKHELRTVAYLTETACSDFQPR